MSNYTSRLYPYGYGNPQGDNSPSVPRAPYYDLATRTFPTDSSGKYIAGMHPVDQAVAFILGGPLGYILSVPALGLNYEVLTGQPQSRWQALLDAEARRALDAGTVKYLARGDVTLDPLVLDLVVGAPWIASWSASYANNRLPKGAANVKQNVGGRF